MKNMRLPKEIKIDGDVATAFKIWKQQLKIYMQAPGIQDNNEMKEERKVEATRYARVN